MAKKVRPPDGQLRSAVFLDRDGTINVEKDYLYRIEDFEFIPGAPEAIKALRDEGFLAVVVTNQSGVARGYYDIQDVETLHSEIQNQLKVFDTQFDGFYVCPHHEDFGAGDLKGCCGCRKPSPGMLLSAARELGIDLSRSYMVGDKLSDVQAGQRAGCRDSFLVSTGYGQRQALSSEDPVRTFEDLSAVVNYILSQSDR